MDDEGFINAVSSLDKPQLRALLIALHQRVLELEADRNAMRIGISIGRWAGPISVSIAFGVLTAVMR